MSIKNIYNGQHNRHSRHKTMTPETLKAWRDQRKMSQAQLGKFLSLNEKTINRYETGQSPIPDDMDQGLTSVLKNPPALDWPPQAVARSASPSRYLAGYYHFDGRPMTHATYHELDNG